jgi:hypothetical protein
MTDEKDTGVGANDSEEESSPDLLAPDANKDFEDRLFRLKARFGDEISLPSEKPEGKRKLEREIERVHTLRLAEEHDGFLTLNDVKGFFGCSHSKASKLMKRLEGEGYFISYRVYHSGTWINWKVWERTGKE